MDLTCKAQCQLPITLVCWLTIRTETVRRTTTIRMTSLVITITNSLKEDWVIMRTRGIGVTRSLLGTGKGKAQAMMNTIGGTDKLSVPRDSSSVILFSLRL